MIPRFGSRIARRVVLLLVAGLTAFFFAGCSVLADLNSYSYTVTFYKNDGTNTVLGTKTGVDSIIMADSSRYAGVYSVQYNELD